MNPINQLATGVCDCMVKLAPAAFLNSLRKNHYDLVAREFNRPIHFDWKKVTIPENPDSFEQLAPLFGLTPMGRGIIRQDFDEAAALFLAIRSLPKPKGVEIGRFNGGSTLMIAVALGASGFLTSIDIAPQNDQTLEDVLKRAGVRSRVNLVIADANQVPWAEKLDFVFIDGDHSYEGARRDHNLWGKRVREGGLIIHHDMANSRPLSTQWSELGVLRSKIIQTQSKHLDLIREAGSMAIFKKRDTSWTDV